MMQVQKLMKIHLDCDTVESLLVGVQCSWITLTHKFMCPGMFNKVISCLTNRLHMKHCSHEQAKFLTIQEVEFDSSVASFALYL